MNLHFEGATRLNASRKAVFDQLTDPHRLAGIIPKKDEVRIVEGSKVEAKVDVPEAGGVFRVEVSVDEVDPPSKARLTTIGSGAESSLAIRGGFDLLGDSPTWIYWEADADVEGAMADFARGELDALADKKVEEIFKDLAYAVERRDA